MEALEFPTPVLSPGARVEVDYGAGVLVCRLRTWQRTTLHLSAPPGARRALELQNGGSVGLTLYPPPAHPLAPGACLESEASLRGWVWTRPPLLVVAPLGPWREKWRRAAPRAPRQLAARLVVAGGTQYVGRTQDVSAGGVSLMVAGAAEIPEGTLGWLTLEIEEGHWCEDLPVRIARARHWLRRAGRSVEVGAEFRLRAERQITHWQQCLTRLGVEE